MYRSEISLVNYLVYILNLHSYHLFLYLLFQGSTSFETQCFYHLLFNASLQILFPPKLLVSYLPFTFHAQPLGYLQINPCMLCLCPLTIPIPLSLLVPLQPHVYVLFLSYPNPINLNVIDLFQPSHMYHLELVLFPNHHLQIAIYCCFLSS